MLAKLEKLACDLLPNPLTLPSKTILQSFHPLAIFGQICGFFPLQNILTRLPFYSPKQFKFHLFSYPVFYSIFINLILYSLTFEATSDYWLKRGNIFKFSTDAFAIQIFLAVLLVLRFTLHLLCIFRASRVMHCLSRLEAYDNFFNLENKTTLLNKYLIIYLIGTAVNTVGNVIASLPSVMANVHNNFYHSETKYLIFLIIPNPKLLAILGYGNHIIAEAALFFSHCCITFVITGICDRLSKISEEIWEIAKDSNYSFLRTPVVHDEQKSETDSHRNTKLTLWINQVHSYPLTDIYNGYPTKEKNSIFDNSESLLKVGGANPENEKTIKLKTLCSQYISLVEISHLLNDFAKETVAVFTAGSTVMLVALFYLICILLTQYVPVSQTRIKETREIVPIIFIATITFLRLLNFINIGDKLRCDVSF